MRARLSGSERTPGPHSALGDSRRGQAAPAGGSPSPPRRVAPELRFPRRRRCWSPWREVAARSCPRAVVTASPAALREGEAGNRAGIPGKSGTNIPSASYSRQEVATCPVRLLATWLSPLCPGGKENWGQETLARAPPAPAGMRGDGLRPPADLYPIRAQETRDTGGASPSTGLVKRTKTRSSAFASDDTCLLHGAERSWPSFLLDPPEGGLRGRGVAWTDLHSLWSHVACGRQSPQGTAMAMTSPVPPS